MTFHYQRCDLIGEDLHWLSVAGLSEKSGFIASCQLDYWHTSTPFLARVMVSESYRRQGIGEAMVRSVLQKCAEREKKTLSMWVHGENKAALSLYEKIGFRLCFIDHTDGKHFLSIPIGGDK